MSGRRRRGVVSRRADSPGTCARGALLACLLSSHLCPWSASVVPSFFALMPVGHFGRPFFLRACPIYNGVGAHLCLPAAGGTPLRPGYENRRPVDNLWVADGALFCGGTPAEVRSGARDCATHVVTVWGAGAEVPCGVSAGPSTVEPCGVRCPKCGCGGVGRSAPFSVCRRACPFCRGRPLWVRALRPGLREPSRSGRGLRERGPRRAQLPREPAPPSPGGRSGS